MTHRTAVNEYTGRHVAECTECDWLGPTRLTPARARQDANSHGSLDARPLKWVKLRRGAYVYGETGYEVSWEFGSIDGRSPEAGRWVVTHDSRTFDPFKTMKAAREAVERRVALERTEVVA